MPRGSGTQAMPTSQFNVSVRQSPSRQNLETIQASGLDSINVPYEEMINTERRKALSQSMRTKQILLMGQLDLKQRIQLEKKLTKKFEKAEKNQKRLDKERKDILMR